MNGGIGGSRRFSSTTSSKPKTAIVMMNLGGPATQQDVNPFLTRLFSDREIIPLPLQKYLGPAIANFRTSSVKKLYAEIGGGSPIRKWTQLQGERMAKRLDEINPEHAPHKSYIAFRYAEPLTDECLEEMHHDGVSRAVAFTQYPQWSCTTTGGSLNELWRGLKRMDMEERYKWSIIDRWHVHNGFVKAVGERVQEGINLFPEEDRKDVVILFSAHSLPMKIVRRGDAYPQEVGATVEKVMEYLKFSNRYLLSWQSAVGPSDWLGPQTKEMVKLLGKRGNQSVLMVPIAFTSDHIETLSELDIEVTEEGHKHGIKAIKRAPSLNDSPHFVDALADIVKRHMKSGELHSQQYSLRCPGCVNPQCRNIINPI